MTASVRPVCRVCGWLVLLAAVAPAPAQEKPVVGLVPRAVKPVTLDGRLDEWAGAFVTPLHVGHPDFLNRGAEVLWLWDDDNLYVGLRCLDRKPAHVGADNQVWNGDAVEFYLDTRRGERLGAREFGPGTLHLFYTPFTGTEIEPRIQVRDLPAFKDFKLQGAKVAGMRTATGYTAEFVLPWANFPEFKPRAGEVIGLECELCSSDGGPRVDRTFTYASPEAVSTPAAFGRVRLVDRLEPDALAGVGKVLLPLSLAKSGNYPWLHGTVVVSPSIARSVARIEGRVIGVGNKVIKTAAAAPRPLEGTGFTGWTGSWELYDVPAGTYTLELTAYDREGKRVTSRSERFLHGDVPPPRRLPAD